MSAFPAKSHRSMSFRHSSSFRHKHKATPTFMHPDSSFQTSWHICILANYTNHCSHHWVKITGCNFIRVVWGIWTGIAPPSVRFASCVPYDCLRFWCVDSTSWSQTCVQWGCSGSCENQHPFLCKRWQDAAILLAFAKRVLCARAAPQIVAAQFVLLHYVKDTKKLKAGKGLSNLVM